MKEESACEEKDRKSQTPKEHLVTFHITERAEDEMLSLIKF